MAKISQLSTLTTVTNTTIFPVVLDGLSYKVEFGSFKDQIQASAQGATGPTGAASTVAGPTGPTGPTGATGPVGQFTASESAPPIDASEAGDAWFNTQNAKTYVFFNGTWVEVASGNLGPTGPQGQAGSLALSTMWWLGA